MQERKRIKKTAQISHHECVACGCCAKVCPRQAISIARGVRAIVNAERCVGCGKCAAECPASVIRMQEVTA